MTKKCLILILMVFVFSLFDLQRSFAENVKIKSSKNGTDGNPIMLAGVLTKPQGDGPFPAVVLLHGCTGFKYTKRRSEQWSNRLVKWGYVTLQVDSFEPRNIT